MNDALARVCHQCAMVFAVEDETSFAAADAQSTPNDTGDDRAERAHVPESFAQSMNALADPERIVAPSPAATDDAVVTVTADAERGGDGAQPVQRRRAQRAAIAAALVVAIAALAYFVHRPSTALNEWLASVQLGVLALAHSNPRPMPATSSIAVPEQSAPAAPPVSNQAADERIVVPTQPTAAAPATTSQDGAAEVQAARAPVQADQATPSEAPAAAQAQPAEFDERTATPSPPAAKRAPAAASSTKRRAVASAAYDVPVPRSQVPAAATPADRPCTRAVAALGLC